MNKKLQEFLVKKPEVIIEWQDDESPAKGWAVFNSLRNGAAGGGTRMRADCNKDEIVELAKTMEIKFTVSGPDIGGAKSGIAYNFKNQADKLSVLKRWYAFILPELHTRYGTGGDQNLDMNRDVSPLLKSLGINHPQEGIVRGHLKNLSTSGQNEIIDKLNIGVDLKINNDSFLRDLNFTIADAATGYGVRSATRCYYDLIGQDIKNTKVIIEGFGNVGSAAAYYMYKLGVKVVGIIDFNWYAFDDNGLNIPELLQAMRTGVAHSSINSGKPSFYPEADIFIPAATSHTINTDRFAVLKKIGVKTIVCGANNPFDNETTAEKVDQEVALIPDFVANAGMARVFSYLMTEDCRLAEGDILSDIDNCLSVAVKNVLNFNRSLYNFRSTAYDIALDKLLLY